MVAGMVGLAGLILLDGTTRRGGWEIQNRKIALWECLIRWTEQLKLVNWLVKGWRIEWSSLCSPGLTRLSFLLTILPLFTWPSFLELVGLRFFFHPILFSTFPSPYKSSVLPHRVIPLLGCNRRIEVEINRKIKGIHLRAYFRKIQVEIHRQISLPPP